VYEGLADTDLLTLARTNPEAFGAFYRRHAEDLLGYFVRRTFDPESAAELTAETFAQAISSLGRFRDQGVGGAAWLYAIARHQLSHFRRRGAVDARARRRMAMPDRSLSPEDQERIEEMIDTADVRRAVSEAFSELSEEHRRALTLRVLDGRPYSEVAAELDCTEQAARARVSRALRRLGALAAEHGVERPSVEVGGGGA
jgi:RNA polymerase sigma-70 factor (ECF subfamily)